MGVIVGKTYDDDLYAYVIDGGRDIECDGDED